MKPRRWYSSPEMSPNSRTRAVPFASQIQLAYAARTSQQQGPIIKAPRDEPQRAARERDPQALSAAAAVRRIDAA